MEEKRDLKNGQGIIFKNKYKTEDRHPEYKGTIKTPTGEEFEIGLYVNSDKNGNKYFKAYLNTPYKKSDEPKKVISTPIQEKDDNDLPF